VIRHIMPWHATGPGDVTLLTARGRLLTKRITPEGIEDYDDAALFSVDAVRLDGIEDVAQLLAELAPKSSSCIVRAALKDPVDPRSEIRCRIRDREGQPARFAEVPRSWLMVDLEPASCPVDPTDAPMVGGWLRRQLPAPFQMARCVVQLSSGAGIKPGARAHVWLWTDRPLVRAELERLLGGVPGLDPSTLRPRQIHYTADPIFADVDDPCPERIAILPGLAEVAVPGLEPEPERPRPAFAPVGITRVSAAAAERYAEACLRRLALEPPGRRHPAILRVGCRLFEIAQAGQLDPARVAAQIKGVARPWGDLSEVDKILAWCWGQVQPKGLGR
jgi:hypothetical protein